MKKRIMFLLSAALLTSGMVWRAEMTSGGVPLVQAAEGEAEIVFGSGPEDDLFSDQGSTDPGTIDPESEGSVSEEPGNTETNTSDTESAAESVTEELPADPDGSQTAVEEFVVPESVELLLDEGLELVPAAMLPYLEDQTTARARLHYSDGSEQILTGGSDRYGNSCRISYEDTAAEDGSVSRTYTLIVESDRTEEGEELCLSETVVFGQTVPEGVADIEAEERTKIRFSGKKSWVMVQSVPQVTGTYSLQSFGRDVKELYYLADGESEVKRAEDTLELNKDVTYLFLLKLAE